MRYLITGGTGYIGRALCRSLLDDGADVFVWTRDVERAATVLPPNAVLVGDLAHAPRVDVVVNLAGANLAEARWSEDRKQALVHSRIATTRRLVDWIATQRIKPALLISGSAVGWYGARDDTPLDETSAGGSDFAARLCAAWEREAMRAARFIPRVCCVRIGIVLSRDGGTVARMAPALRWGIGSRYGSGRQWVSWIARDDLVRLMRWLAAQPRAQGPYNATAPAPLMNAAFADAVARGLGRRALLPVPAWMLRTALGEMADLLLTGQRVLPARAQAEGFAFAFTDPAQALLAQASPSSATPSTAADAAVSALR